MSYCVEINEHFSFPTATCAGYTVVAAADYVSSYYLPGSSTPMGAERANRLGQLMSYVAADSMRVDSAPESTSLQLAIWNLIYDTDDTLLAGTLQGEHVQRCLRCLCAIRCWRRR